MIRLARIYRRFFGTWDVHVFNNEHEPECVLLGEDVVWIWQARGVLHLVFLYGGRKHDPQYRLDHWVFPLVNVAYWTKERL